MKLYNVYVYSTRDGLNVWEICEVIEEKEGVKA